MTDTLSEETSAKNREYQRNTLKTYLETIFAQYKIKGTNRRSLDNKLKLKKKLQ